MAILNAKQEVIGCMPASGPSSFWFHCVWVSGIQIHPFNSGIIRLFTFLKKSPSQHLIFVQQFRRVANVAKMKTLHIAELIVLRTKTIKRSGGGVDGFNHNRTSATLQITSLPLDERSVPMTLFIRVFMSIIIMTCPIKCFHMEKKKAAEYNHIIPLNKTPNPTHTRTHLRGEVTCVRILPNAPSTPPCGVLC